MLQPRAATRVKMFTKERLDGHRAPGQTYEGLILEMLQLWEEVVGDGYSGRAFL